jgi:hypothetical protein
MQNPTLTRHIASVDEALYFLEHRWLFVEGAAHKEAVRTCREVLGGKGSNLKAKDAFLRALEEAQYQLVE